MIRSISLLVEVAALLGFGAAQLWGPSSGVGAAVLVLVIGAVVLVLRQNQKDLRQLELAPPDEELDEAAWKPRAVESRASRLGDRRG